MNRKQFIESHGATCRNWRWSWSFVNHSKKLVIFGAWDGQTDGNKSRILDEAWERSHSGKRQPGYKQAIEHIHLLESGMYTLATFPMIYSDEQVDASGHGPATIGNFDADLTERRLIKEGTTWYAIG